MQTTENKPRRTLKDKDHPFWRFFWLTFLVLSLAYAWYSFYAPSNAIKWVNNVTSVAELTSKNPDKNTLIFYTGEWCSPCRIMKREVFADAEVEKMVNAHVTPLMVDIDNPQTKELVEAYKVVATPTTLLVNSKGEVIQYFVGKMDKEQFLDMLSLAVK